MGDFTEEFKKQITAMLQAEAAQDPLFAESLKKEGKTMDECCDFIIAQVEKSGKQGFADAEILGIAKHYWDEDNPGDTKHSPCRIIVNREIELSEEEKAEAKRRAMELLVEQEKKRMSEKPKKQPKPQAETAQGSLFDL
jgi:hypothetical protein